MLYLHTTDIHLSINKANGKEIYPKVSLYSNLDLNCPQFFDELKLS